MELTPDKKMSKARTGLILDNPFFGSLALKLKLQSSATQGNGRKLPLASTDGTYLRYNPEAVDELTLEQTKGLIAHEVMHCALLHHTRMQQRSLKKWNYACDFVIDELLDKSGFVVPESFHINSTYDGMSAEAIYAALPDMDGSDGQEQDQGQGQGSGQDGASTGTNSDPNQDPSQDTSDSNRNQPDDGSGDDPGGNGGVEEPRYEEGEDKQNKTIQEEQDWTISLIQAAEQAKAMGQLPAGVDRFVEEVKEAKIDWKKELWNFVDSNCKDDYTFARPNQRYMQQGVILPGLHTQKLGEAICVCDTSGSVSAGELAEYAAELSDILGVFDLELYVYYCDCKVHGEAEVFTKQDLPIKLEFRGGGGTAFSPAFKKIEEDGRSPKFLVYFSDMWCSDFPKTPPDYPVMWLKVGKGGCEAPFGRVIEMEFGKE